MTLRKSACGKLLVTVVSAADLIASSDGKSDPFCVIKVGENQEAATPVVKNDLNPHWNYTVHIYCMCVCVYNLLLIDARVPCNWSQ